MKHLTQVLENEWKVRPRRLVAALLFVAPQPRSLRQSGEARTLEISANAPDSIANDSIANH